MVTPDARSLIVYTAESEQWGFDQYDLTTGKQRTLARWKTDPCNNPAEDRGGFAFTPSGNDLVVVCDWKTHVIDLTTGKERGRLEGHAPVLVEGERIVTAVSADGTRIATADASGLIRLWDAKTLRAITDAPGHRTPVEYAQLSPDGKRLLTWAPDRTIRLWDLTSGKELRAFTGTRRSQKPTFTPDGTIILYSTEKRLLARDLQTGLEVPLPGEMAKLEPRTAMFAPDGKSVLTWAADDRNDKPCEVWEWPSGKKLASWSSNAVDFAPGFSPDGSAIFAAPTSPERWNAKTGQELQPAWKDDRENEILAITSLRPNPQWLIHNVKGSPRVIEAGTGKQVTRFRLAVEFSWWNTAFSPGGGQVAGPLPAQFEQLIQNQKEGRFALLPPRIGEAVWLYEAATNEVRRELRGHRGEVRVLGFTPDGTRLLTAGGDHTVLVWDMRLQNVPLPPAIKNETDARKLWNTLATGNAKDAYLAMARLARDPDAAIKIAKMKLKPATKNDRDTRATRIADSRAIELLESLDTDDARSLLAELADGHADAFRTQEAKRAMERNTR
jgi:WD40 repeat protein